MKVLIISMVVITMVLFPTITTMVYANTQTVTAAEIKLNNQLIKAQQQGNYSGIFDIQMKSGLSDCAKVGNATSHITPNQVYYCGIGCKNAQNNLLSVNNASDYNKRVPTYNNACSFVSGGLTER